MTPIFHAGTIVEKKWGYELIIHNDADYCSKILHFKAGSKFSLHFHILKRETWYVKSGKFLITYIDTETAQEQEVPLVPGAIVHLERGVPHQLFAIEEGEIFEASTQHHDTDSYRIKPGNSQQ